MMTRMKWMVAIGTLLLTAGCGPLESEDSLPPLSTDVETEASPETLDAYSTSRCQADRDRCFARCGQDTPCRQRCRINFELCVG